MKKIIFLLIVFIATMFCACSSNDNNKDEFYQKQVTLAELESGTATYEMKKGTKTYYLVFEDRYLTYYEYMGGKFTDNRSVEYSIDGDSIRMVKHPFMEDVLGGEKEYYSLYINMVHWGFDKTSETGTGGEQLLIRGDKIPYMLQTGYYDKSYTSLILK